MTVLSCSKLKSSRVTQLITLNVTRHMHIRSYARTLLANRSRDHPIESLNDYVTQMPNETRKVQEVDFSLHNPKKPNQCARTDYCVAVCWQAGTSTATVLRFYLFDPSTWNSTIHLSHLTTKSNAPQSIISVNVMTDHFPTSADWDHKAYSMRSKDGTFGVHPWFPRRGHWAIFLIYKGQRVRLAFHSTWPE